MLADHQSGGLTQIGSLDSDVHLPASSRYELIDFIADQLPLWRDRIERKGVVAETVLTSQLCAHLNSAARLSGGWDFLQFRVEESDEENPGRKIDLVPAPSGVAVWIDSRRYVDFDTLMPIECKRLPTPSGATRDAREYVFNENASTGGIQRFKEGLHGAKHALGGMIAYIQEETAEDWHPRVSTWIDGLARAGEPGWSTTDLVHAEGLPKRSGLSRYKSNHTRISGLSSIELRHLWIEMPLPSA